MAGFISILPYRLGMTLTSDVVPPGPAFAGFLTPIPGVAFSLGGGTIVPIAPVSTTAVRARALISSLDIRREITEIRNKRDQNLALALTNVQDWANTSDQRLRDVAGSLNSVGLTRDPAGNVLIKSSTFTISLPQQSFSMSGRSTFQSVPPAAPVDSQIAPSQMTMWLNEGTDTLTIRIRKSDGSYITKTL